MSGAAAGASGGGGGGASGSRAWRKFVRSRVAVLSMLVVLVYAAIGVLCTVGVITSRDASSRVGPDAVPGWLSRPNPEQRLEFAEFYRKTVETALKRQDPGAALAQIDLGGRRPAGFAGGAPGDAGAVDRLRGLVKQAGDLHDEAADLLDEGLALEAKLARADKPGAAEKDRLDGPKREAAVHRAAEVRGEVDGKLAELERKVDELMPRPEGRAGAWHRLATVLGTDRQGRSVAVRALYSIRIALQVGLIVAGIAVVVGTLLGAAAGFFGGWIDHAVTWLYTTFSSIPELVLLSLLAYVFQGIRFGEAFELIPVYAALSLTFWIGPCRVVRGEVLKLKQLEYVQAATAIGFGRWRILLRHIVPNTTHLMLINFSLLFIGAIKAEVILTFLGLGVKNGASWGIMIEQSRQEVIKGNYWQIGAATAAMFVLVLAFNIISDALQDAFDPRHVG